MIGPLANTRIWVAAGFTDMRCGFDGLAAKVQTVRRIHSLVTSSCSGANVATSSNACTGATVAYACSPNAWSVGALRGLVLTVVLCR
jgi:transposase